jgi:amino acid transporter
LAFVTDTNSGATSQTKAPATLPRLLGTGGLTAFGLAYMVPLAVFATFGAATRETLGHLPTAYAVTTIAMLFTAFSYALNVRAYPSAGSAYTYSQKSFGNAVGFLTGWALLLDYLLLPALNYVVIGIYLNAQFPLIPGWTFALGTIIFVTVLNIVGITTVKRISLLLVAMQIVFTVVFVFLAYRNAGVATDWERPFYSAEFSWKAIFTGSAILCISFLGFDAVSTMSEEAQDPRRTVPRAIIFTTLLGGLIFVVVSYFSAIALPDWRSIQVSDSAGIEVMAPVGGVVLVSVFVAAYCAGCVASAVAAQASVGRILFAMGRDGILPRQFAFVHPRWRTPTVAILSAALASFGGSWLSLETIATVINFGALLAFSAVNISVVKHFMIDKGQRRPRDFVIYGIVPCLGFAMTGWLWANLAWAAFIAGVAWLLLGCVYLLVRTRGFRVPVATTSFNEA